VGATKVGDDAAIELEVVVVVTVVETTATRAILDIQWTVAVVPAAPVAP
jgi:hypothetical protein